MRLVFQRDGIRTTDFVLPKSNIKVITQHWQDFVNNILPYPDNFEGRGIVICAGGKNYFTCCWILINVLRNELDCNLPIEIWYRGNEITPELDEVLMKLNVTCHNVEDFYDISPDMSGYVMKPMAILFSHFKEVLFLDADNICTMNPEFLFDLPEYKEYGAMFWPDFWTTDKNNQIWEIMGVPANSNKEQESGQILINKETCWRELNLALYFNMNNHIYYNYLIGDKDTFRFAWLALKTPFYFIKHEVASCGYIDEDGLFIGHTMAQHTPDGRIIFLHRNLLKWNETDIQYQTWDKIKKFTAESVLKIYIIYRDFKKAKNVMNLEGDLTLLDFKSLFGDLESRCLKYLQSLREEEFYQRL
ncbi:hypothetical protein [Bacteroides sp.]|uniref:hypothetical protein n=1 Tax=Bacteroides sp. TaxID=29523 RepID=UPI00260AD0FC|nr:hypothetical protein [Bacteroides sp.]MDD3038224.1 hypothetical protein [Bacteroides sp.]